MIKIKESIKNFLKTIIILGIIILGTAIFNKIFHLKCLSLLFFDIPCPFCGMTRAHLSLLKGNVTQAFEYNPLFFLGVPTLYLLLDTNIAKNHPKFYKWYMIIAFTLLLGMNFIRIIKII